MKWYPSQEHPDFRGYFRDGPTCNLTTDKERCPKCDRKLRPDAIEPRREPDMVDLFARTRTDFQGIPLQVALEILNNGDCAD